ncbi:MAG: cyclic nucleotide-binding domain-containing protein [Chloroflexi bacterium]|nr:cyclic nucleotide-binding domain-containing protein [Chloroflexota bacterium]
MREGEPGNTCYLVRAGQAGVIGRDLIGAEVTLAVFGPGDSFGEGALVAERPRSATVRAPSRAPSILNGAPMDAVSALAPSAQQG